MDLLIHSRGRYILLQLLTLVVFLNSCFTESSTEYFLSTLVMNVTTNNSSTNVLTFSPPRLDGLVQGTNQTVYFNYTGESNTIVKPMFQVSSADDTIARVVTVKSSLGANGSLFLDPNNTQFQYKLDVFGEFMGRTHLKFMIPGSLATVTSNTKKYGAVLSTGAKENKSFSSDITESGVIKSPTDGAENWREIPGEYDVSVVRAETWVDYVFIAVVTFLVLCANIFMGFKIELEVVKEVLKKPFAPAIGFLCQFGFMPVVAFGTVRMLKLEGGQALGLFAAGCAPGGGASNIYTYILGGDVSLSVTMTLVSTVASFGMIPLWLYTLGTQLIDDKYNISIPFSTIFLSLLGIIVPVGIGMLIQRKKPQLVEKLVKYLKPVFVILIIFIFVFGIWVNRYVFRLFTKEIVIAGFFLPYTGFILSGVTAAICRQPLHRIVTIIIETGIQNTGIPIILMRFSLPQPEADLSLISPAIVAAFTPFPLWIAFLIKEIYRRRCKRKDKRQDFTFHRVHTDSDASPEEDGMDLDSAITFDTTGSNNNSKNGYIIAEDVA